MPQFRKKPVVIDAIEWQGQPPGFVADSLEVSRDLFSMRPFYRPDLPPAKLQVKTLEGMVEAAMGDWIIKGIAGECYPCKPDIFDKTYERVT